MLLVLISCLIDCSHNSNRPISVISHVSKYRFFCRDDAKTKHMDTRIRDSDRFRILHRYFCSHIFRKRQEYDSSAQFSPPPGPILSILKAVANTNFEQTRYSIHFPRDFDNIWMPMGSFAMLKSCCIIGLLIFFRRRNHPVWNLHFFGALP